MTASTSDDGVTFEPEGEVTVVDIGSVHGQVVLFEPISKSRNGLLNTFSVPATEMERIRGVVADPFDEQVDEEADEVISPARLDEQRERARQEVHDRLADANLECDFSSQVSLGQDLRIDRSESAISRNPPRKVRN